LVVVFTSKVFNPKGHSSPEGFLLRYILPSVDSSLISNQTIQLPPDLLNSFVGRYKSEELDHELPLIRQGDHLYVRENIWTKVVSSFEKSCNMGLLSIKLSKFFHSMGGDMKLRWKYFLVLVAASLVPLLAVTWITQDASRRLGKTISERAQNTLTDTVRQEMVRATRSYAAFSHIGGMTTKLALRVIAGKAELALALPPPLPTRIFYAADFDDPRSAPKDMAPTGQQLH